MSSLKESKKLVTEISVLFLLYIALGISTEVIFTGIADIVRNHMADMPFDRTLPCRASLWIIPVYALSATVAFSAIGRFWPKVFYWPWLVRGLVYMFGIYSFEFVWGFILEQVVGIQVWNYENSEYHIWRYINPYFCFFWFSFGFVLEKVKVVMLPRLLKSV